MQHFRRSLFVALSITTVANPKEGKEIKRILDSFGRMEDEYPHRKKAMERAC